MQESHHIKANIHSTGATVRSADSSGLRAHGKLKGLDVFTWMQPAQEALTQFIATVQTSFIWVVNPTEIAAILTEKPDFNQKFQSILSYGVNQTGFMLENEFEDIQSLLHQLMSELKAPGTLLFTCTDSDSEYVSMKILAYLNLVQLT